VTTVINWPDLTNAAVNALALKGKVSFTLDETLVGTVKLADYSQSPFAVNPHPGITTALQAAVAARFSGVVMFSAENAITLVERVDIINETAGALDYTLNWLSPANFALLNVNSTNTTRDCNAARQVDPGGARLASTFALVDHTATLGQGFFIKTIQPAESFQFTFPSGFALYGNDRLGLSGIVVWCETVNNPVRATVHVNEFKLPG